MRHFHKILTPSLAALAFFLPVPALAENSGIRLKLMPTGALPSYSGSVAIYANERGNYNFEVRVDGPLEEGELLKVDLVYQDGEGLDVVLMSCELGRALFSCGPDGVEPAPAFPVERITAFFVYYQGIRILEAKMPA